MTGTLAERAVDKRRLIISGDAADAGLLEVSNGEPGVQYARQTSINRSAGLLPHPIRLPNPPAAETDL